MLINTVILFLRDALPIFVLLGLLIAQVSLSKRGLSLALIGGLLLALFFIRQVDSLGAMFDGAGIELTFWLLHFLVYCNVVLLGDAVLRKGTQNRWPVSLAVSLMILIILAKATNFLLYLNGFLNQTNAAQSLLLGTLLGLGICLSVAVLLYFFVNWLKLRFGFLAAITTLLVFASGQLINALNLLVQVDWLPTLAPVWDSQWLVDNESEYGHLFNVLFGYVATPSFLQMGVFMCAILLPWFHYWRVTTHQNIQRGNSL